MNNMTRGSVPKQIILFAIPLFISSLIQLMYNTVDLIFVGNFLGSKYAAAVGASGMIVNCIIGFFTGLGIGAGVVCAKAVGRDDQKLVKKIIHTAMALTFIMIIVFTVFGFMFSPWILQMMNTPKEIMNNAIIYIRIYILSLFSIITYDIGSGLIKALGNSKSPMFYQFIGGIFNIIGNYLFICVFHLGIKGAACTTLLSQFVASVLVLRYLMKLPREYSLEFRCLSLNFSIVKDILFIGIPAAIQAIILNISNLFVQSSINKLGVDSIAAFSAYYRAENVIYYPIMAFGQACSTFVSQNVGVQDYDRVKEGTKDTIIIGGAVTISLCIISLIFVHPLFSIFLKEEKVIELGCQIARRTFTFYFLFVLLEVFASSIRGQGKALQSMVITIINMCIIRILVLSIIMHVSPVLSSVACVYPITWLACSICSGAYYFYLVKQY